MIIKRPDGKWELRTIDGNRVIGIHATKADAMAQERAIEMAKHKSRDEVKTSDRLSIVLDDLIETKDSDAPKWHLLFPLGKTKFREDFPGGRITFSAQMLRTMESNAKRIMSATGHEFPVNFNHFGGIQPEPSAPLELSVAFGWIKDVAFDGVGNSEEKADGPGLYSLIQYTEKAKQLIRNKEIRYISPEFSLEYINRDTGENQGATLLGAGLTNTPFLKELPAIAAKDKQAGGVQMEMKKLAEVLGLAEHATEEDIMAAIAELLKTKGEASMQDKEKDEATMKASDNALKLSELQAATTKLSEELKGANAKLNAMAVEKKDAEVSAYVASLVKTGKITPAMSENVKRLALVDFALAKATFDGAPSVVEFRELGITGDLADKPDESFRKFSALADEIQKADGISGTDAMRRALKKDKTLASAISVTQLK